MARNDEVEHVNHRNFGFKEFFWVIDNYFSATCKKDWVVESPEFSVNCPQITKWRISLKPKCKEEKSYIQTFLERLEYDPFPEDVRVKWILSHAYGDKDFAKTERTGIFGKDSRFTTWLTGVDKTEKRMLSSSCYTFSVRFKFIVYSKSNNLKYNIPEDLGLKYLAQDMRTLYKTNKNFDVLLRIGSDDIRAHRAILCARNSILKTEVEKQGEVLHFEDLRTVQKGTASDFFGYLYTGNLEYIMRTPSFSMQDLIDYFKVNELQNYYLKDEMTIQTNYDAYVFNFQWLITDLSCLLQDCVLSPLWHIDVLNLKFYVRLYPKGFEDDNGHMFLFGEFVGHEEPEEVIFACGIGGDKLTWKYQRWSSKENKKLGFEKIISTDIINDNSVVIGCLRVLCKLIIPAGNDYIHNIIKSKTCSVVCMGKNHHYKRLSMDLKALLEKGTLSDITLATRIFRFRAHKVVLSCRSYVIGNMLKDVQDDGSLHISDIPPNAMRTVISYIYSGVLRKQNNVKDIKNIYSAAIKFSILSLKNACSQLLIDHLTVDNVLEILILSHRQMDLKLKHGAFKFILLNLRMVCVQEQWHAFIDANPHLYEELTRCLKEYANKKGVKLSHCVIRDFIKYFC